MRNRTKSRSGGSAPMKTIRLLCGTALAAGVLSPAAGATAATSFTFDTGSGLVFTVDGANGNLTSLKHRGVELAAPGQAAGQFESGWSSATVSGQAFDGGNSMLITAA